MGRPPAWVLGEVLTSPQCKSISVLKNVTPGLGLRWTLYNDINN